MIELKLSQQQINIIIGALHEIPHKFASPLIAEIMKQIKDVPEDAAG